MDARREEQGREERLSRGGKGVKKGREGEK